jgi:hypothetical protein
MSEARSAISKPEIVSLSNEKMPFQLRFLWPSGSCVGPRWLQGCQALNPGDRRRPISPGIPKEPSDPHSSMAGNQVECRRACVVSPIRNGRNVGMERKKTGRPSKGDRAHVSFKLPTPLLEKLKQRAAERGMTATDLVGEALASELGVPYQTQEGLPLNQAS